MKKFVKVTVFAAAAVFLFATDHPGWGCFMLIVAACSL
jgi:hypothetical protein